MTLESYGYVSFLYIFRPIQFLLEDCSAGNWSKFSLKNITAGKKKDSRFICLELNSVAFSFVVIRPNVFRFENERFKVTLKEVILALLRFSFTYLHLCLGFHLILEIAMIKYGKIYNIQTTTRDWHAISGTNLPIGIFKHWNYLKGRTNSMNKTVLL